MTEGNAPWGPPVKAGRIMQGCSPKNDKDGNKVAWGAVEYADLFGPKGWCNDDNSEFK
jgi:hypothetical protein